MVYLTFTYMCIVNPLSSLVELLSEDDKLLSVIICSRGLKLNFITQAARSQYHNNVSDHYGDGEIT